MTTRLPELADLPPGLVLDGELVAFNDHGDPHFPLLSRRILNDDRAIPATLMVFDVLAIDGETLLSQPYSVRRRRLEELALDGHAWTTPASFDDGAALSDAVCERGLEGVVAAAPIAVPAGKARLGEDQEPGLLAARVRDRHDTVLPPLAESVSAET